MELTMDQIKGYRLWKQICKDYDPAVHSGGEDDHRSLAYFVINEANSMWRKGDITAEVLAVVVDAVMHY